MKKGWGQATGWVQCFQFPSVLWHCWLGDRKEIWLVITTCATYLSFLCLFCVIFVFLVFCVSWYFWIIVLLCCQYQCNWLPGKTVPEMTYNVSIGMLSICSVTHYIPHMVCGEWHLVQYSEDWTGQVPTQPGSIICSATPIKLKRHCTNHHTVYFNIRLCTVLKKNTLYCFV